MGNFYEIDGIRPVVGRSTFVHPNAVIIGDVIIGDNCYIGPLCSLRGDFGKIRVGDGANIQDQCVLHSFPEKICSVGESGHVSHGAILHGCTVNNNGFIGINSVIMDDVEIGESAMVGAMAFVKSGFIVPPRMLATGIPARVIRDLSEVELSWVRNGPLQYQNLTRRSLHTLKSCRPLLEETDERLKMSFDAPISMPLHEARQEKE